MSGSDGEVPVIEVEGGTPSQGPQSEEIELSSDVLEVIALVNSKTPRGSEDRRRTSQTNTDEPARDPQRPAPAAAASTAPPPPPTSQPRPSKRNTARFYGTKQLAWYMKTGTPDGAKVFPARSKDGEMAPQWKATASKRPRITHFLALRIKSPNILRRLKGLQYNLVTRWQGPNGKKRLEPPEKFHISLQVMASPNRESVELLGAMLERLAPEFQRIVQESFGTDPPTLQLQGLKQFKRGEVLYSPLKNDKASHALRKIYHVIKKELDLIPNIYIAKQNYRPYVSIFKRMQNAHKRSLGALARANAAENHELLQGLIRSHQRTQFGEQPILDLQLCNIGTGKRRGAYYHVEKSVRLVTEKQYRSAVRKIKQTEADGIRRQREAEENITFRATPLGIRLKPEDGATVVESCEKRPYLVGAILLHINGGEVRDTDYEDIIRLVKNELSVAHPQLMLGFQLSPLEMVRKRLKTLQQTLEDHDIGQHAAEKIVECVQEWHTEHQNTDGFTRELGRVDLLLRPFTDKMIVDRLIQIRNEIWRGRDIGASAVLGILKAVERTRQLKGDVAAGVRREIRAALPTVVVSVFDRIQTLRVTLKEHDLSKEDCLNLLEQTEALCKKYPYARFPMMSSIQIYLRKMLSDGKVPPLAPSSPDTASRIKKRVLRTWRSESRKRREEKRREQPTRPPRTRFPARDRRKSLPPRADPEDRVPNDRRRRRGGRDRSDRTDRRFTPTLAARPRREEPPPPRRTQPARRGADESAPEREARYRNRRGGRNRRKHTGITKRFNRRPLGFKVEQANRQTGRGAVVIQIQDKCLPRAIMDTRVASVKGRNVYNMRYDDILDEIQDTAPPFDITFQR